MKETDFSQKTRYKYAIFFKPDQNSFFQKKKKEMQFFTKTDQNIKETVFFK